MCNLSIRWNFLQTGCDREVGLPAYTFFSPFLGCVCVDMDLLTNVIMASLTILRRSLLSTEQIKALKMSIHPKYFRTKHISVYLNHFIHLMKYINNYEQ